MDGAFGSIVRNQKLYDDQHTVNSINSVHAQCDRSVESQKKLAAVAAADLAFRQPQLESARPLQAARPALRTTVNRRQQPLRESAAKQHQRRARVAGTGQPVRCARQSNESANRPKPWLDLAVWLASQHGATALAAAAESVRLVDNTAASDWELVRAAGEHQPGDRRLPLRRPLATKNVTIWAAGGDVVVAPVAAIPIRATVAASAADITFRATIAAIVIVTILAATANANLRSAAAEPANHGRPLLVERTGRDDRVARRHSLSGSGASTTAATASSREQVFRDGDVCEAARGARIEDA